jgi:hypothetical protein
VALPAGQLFHPLAIAHHQCGGDPAQQRAKVGVGQAVVQRAIGHAGQRRTEHGDDARLARFVEQGDELGLAVGDQFRRTARGADQFAIGPAFAVADQADAVTGGIGRHFEQKGDIHGGSAFVWISRTREAAWLP